MSESLPVQLDPVTLAARGRGLRGTLPIAGFHRLTAWLPHTDGTLAFTLDFGRDDHGRSCLQGHVSGGLGMICERCLGEYTLTLDHAFSLVLVTSEAEAETLPEEVDAVVIGEARSMQTADLVEDEIILALPLVPRCERAEDCRPAVELLASEELDGADPDARQNPFAGLADEMDPDSEIDPDSRD